MHQQSSLNKWSCLFDCFHYAFSINGSLTQEALLQRIGHDGSKIMWKDYPEPLCRRSFHPQEFVRVGLDLGFSVTCIEKYSYLAPDVKTVPFEIEWDISRYLQIYEGVLTGTCRTRAVRHAVFWHKTGYIFDPVGVCKNVDQFDIENFWVVEKIG